MLTLQSRWPSSSPGFSRLGKQNTKMRNAFQYKPQLENGTAKRSSKKKGLEMGGAVHTYNPGTWELRQEGPEFRASLS